MRQEVIRNLNNAKKILNPFLKKSIVMQRLNQSEEAFASAYLAVLEAINEYLMDIKGITKKELHKSVDAI